MTDIKRIGDSGIHTVEGNVAGGRAAQLTKQRDKEQAEYERLKNKIKEQNSASLGRIDDKFSSSTEVLEQEFRQRTVGLVTAEDFRKARSLVDKAKELTEKKLLEERNALDEKKKADRDAKRKRMVSSLSFANDGADADEESSEFYPSKKLGKDNLVDTSYLPDMDRDKKMQGERSVIAAEWLEQQEIVKSEMLEVVFVSVPLYILFVSSL